MRRALAILISLALALAMGVMSAKPAAADVIAENITVTTTPDSYVVGAATTATVTAVIDETNVGEDTLDPTNGIQAIALVGQDDFTTPIQSTLVSNEKPDGQPIRTIVLELSIADQVDYGVVGVNLIYVRAADTTSTYDVTQIGNGVRGFSPVSIDNVNDSTVLNEGGTNTLRGELTCLETVTRVSVAFETPGVFSVQYRKTTADAWTTLRTATSDSNGEFAVSLAGLPLAGISSIWLRVNVPGYDDRSANCGWTDSQSNTYDFAVKAKPVPPKPRPPVVKAPGVPKNVHYSRTKTTLTLRWSAPAANGKRIDRYQVKRSGKSAKSVSASKRSYKFTKLKSGKYYTLSVRAHNAKGYSAWKSIRARTVPKPPKAKTYKNCAALTRVYPHGVGRPGAVDDGGVTNFYRSTAIYNKNKKSDRDKDGVACER